MGESAHNLDNVDLLVTKSAIGHKNLVFSTVGDCQVFDLLRQRHLKPASAWSLHKMKADLREYLLPIVLTYLGSFMRIPLKISVKYALDLFGILIILS